MPARRLAYILIGFLAALMVIVQLLRVPASLVRTDKNEPKDSQPQFGQAPKKPAQHQVTPAPTVSATQWTNAYFGSHDLFAFIRAAAARGLSGDGRAAFYVGGALARCAALRVEYGTEADPDAAFAAKWAARTNLPQWLVDQARHTLQLCSGLIHGDPFADLPSRPDGYWSQSFWQDQAYAASDPLAQSWHAGDTLSRGMLQTDARANAADVSSAQADINEAVASKDPAALFQVGQILSDGHFSDSKTQGFAIAIAACESGYDCTVSNPSLERYLGCVQLGTCPPGYSYTDLIRQNIGEMAYAQAYEQAQLIEQALFRDEADPAPFFRIKTSHK